MSGGGDSGRWADLGPRLGSGLVLLALGIAAIMAGGAWFAALAALSCGLVLWELSGLLQARDGYAASVSTPGTAGQAGVLLAALGTAAVAAVPHRIAPDMALLFLPALAALFVPVGERGSRLLLTLFALVIPLASWGLVSLREGGGMLLLLWLVAVVVVSDVAGYFAGRILGGPKFWPRMSPKKTWSGTLAGWIGAALVGIAFAAPLGQGSGFVALSILAAIAGQFGDIAESALKRRAGVKDASALIPGHGGVWDRFDALLGAALFVLLVRLASGWPG